MKKWTQQDPRFCKMRGQKDLIVITMKKRVNMIESQGENRYKLCQMTDFCEKIDQL